jgi:mannitol-1-phosphate 5-dehydrogenase
MPTPEMRDQDVSMIRVEPYKELPVDRKGFVGPIPEIAAMEAHDHFPLFTARKLYIHNCGHALLAYVGYLHDYEYGYEAIADPVVRDVLDGGLAESVAAVVAEYGADRDWLEAHRLDLMERFSNRVLADTIFRLGRDPIRKLAASDRLAGAAHLAVRHNDVPRYLAWGIASALFFAPGDDPSAQKLQDLIAMNGVERVLESVSEIPAGSKLSGQIISYYQVLREDRRAAFPG